MIRRARLRSRPAPMAAPPAAPGVLVPVDGPVIPRVILTELAAAGGTSGYPITEPMLYQARAIAAAGGRCARCGRARPLQLLGALVVCRDGCAA